MSVMTISGIRYTLADLIRPIDHTYKERMRNNPNMPVPMTKPDSHQIGAPCDVCANACGGCEWSDRFEPVPGWEAIPMTIRARDMWTKPNGKFGYYYHDVDSYAIIDCPKLVVEEHWKDWWAKYDKDMARARAERRKKAAE